jgi:hypothetical protein
MAMTMSCSAVILEHCINLVSHFTPKTNQHLRSNIMVMFNLPFSFNNFPFRPW